MSHQPERQDDLPDEKEQKATPAMVESNLSLNTGWSTGTDKEEERNKKLEEKSFFDEVELPEVQVARKESNQPEDTEPEKSASHQPERQDILSDHVNGLPEEKEKKVSKRSKRSREKDIGKDRRSQRSMVKHSSE